MAVWSHNKDYVIFVMNPSGGPGGCLTYFKATGGGGCLTYFKVTGWGRVLDLLKAMFIFKGHVIEFR